MGRWIFVFFFFWAACRLDTSGDLTKDADGDGYSVLDGDCDDGEPSAFPGGVEVPYDGIDQDCDGTDQTDVDRDGFDAEEVGGSDCDDAKAGVHPGVEDLWYDGVDTDCDGSDDFDQDHDGYVPENYAGQATEYVTASGNLPDGDCDDEDGSVNPGAAEVWYDGEDWDCDGASDYDQDGDGFDSDLYEGLDCDDRDAGVNPEAEEVADDGKDNNCENDRPTIDSLALSPEEVTTDSLVMASVEASDPDGDAVEVRYAWYVDGVLDASTGDVLAASHFSRGQVLRVVATPNDGERDGDAVQSDLVTVQNSPPVLSSVTLSSTAPTEADTLSVTVTASDADGDALTTTYRWLVDGAAVGSAATLSAAWFAKDQEVQVEVTASDGTDISATVASSVAVVENTPPVLSWATLSPTVATSTGTFTCSPGTTTDLDGDTVSFRYAWMVSGSTATCSDSTLGPSHHAPGDVVQCVVIPTDGDDDGTAVSTSTAVVNNPPVVMGVSITPDPAYVTDGLTCAHEAATDGDGEVASLAYAWEDVGTGATLGREATLSGVYVKGDQLLCSVTPSDALEAGVGAASATLTISNSLPVIDSLSLTASAIHTADVLGVEVEGSDADGDEVTFDTTWYVGGVAVGETGSTLDGITWFDRGQTVQVEITPEDGDDAGTAVASVTLTVLNTLPTVPEVAISPSHPIAGFDDMVCTLTTPSSDADGDAISYTVDWTRDGTPYSGASTTTLVGDTVRGGAVTTGEFWTCTVTPCDSEGAGLAGSDTVAVGCDDDEDGYLSEACGGDDCDDDAAGVNPDATDTWYDGVDSDCDGWSDYDADGDGYDSAVYGGDDCDDADRAFNPGAIEVWYDGVDQDCGGGSDYDQDGDGYNAASGGGLDCDDTRSDLHPGAEEICNDGVDDDCDGRPELTVPEAYSAIQDAIDDAVDGDLICVGVGTWYEHLDFGGKTLALVGIQGSSYTTIDGSGTGRVLVVDDGEGPGTRVEGFTLAHGYGDLLHRTYTWDYDGGCIYMDGSDLTLQDVVITDCETPASGGAIYLCYMNPGCLTATDVTVSGCTAGGGAITVSDGDLELTRVTIRDCTGGGIQASGGGAVALNEVTIADCTTTGSGGGLYLSAGFVSIVDTTITGCSAQFGGGMSGSAGVSSTIEGLVITDCEADYGGGVDICGGTLSGAVISGNRALSGGGIHISGDAVIEDVVLSGNYAADNGGGFAQSNAASPFFRNCVVTGNVALGSGGGGYANGAGEVTLEDVLLQDNVAVVGGGLYVNEASAVLDGVAIVGNRAACGGGLSLSDDMGWEGVVYVPTVTNTILAGNTSTYCGGAGVYISMMGPYFENVAIVGNEVYLGDGGAGMRIDGGEPTLVNAEFSGNSALDSGGAILAHPGASPPSLTYCNFWDNTPTNFADMPDPIGTDGNTAVNPAYLFTLGTDPGAWDLHLGAASVLIDAGDPTILDPDGSPSDIGAYGGTGADLWDLDGDGYPAWWHPGAYDSGTDSAAGWDCDDLDATVYPGNGC